MSERAWCGGVTWCVTIRHGRGAAPPRRVSPQARRVMANFNKKICAAPRGAARRARRKGAARRRVFSTKKAARRKTPRGAAHKWAYFCVEKVNFWMVDLDLKNIKKRLFKRKSICEPKIAYFLNFCCYNSPLLLGQPLNIYPTHLLRPFGILQLESAIVKIYKRKLLTEK